MGGAKFARYCLFFCSVVLLCGIESYGQFFDGGHPSNRENEERQRKWDEETKRKNDEFDANSKKMHDDFAESKKKKDEAWEKGKKIGTAVLILAIVLPIVACVLIIIGVIVAAILVWYCCFKKKGK